MTILGPNLHQLFSFCEDKFSLRTIIKIMMQMIQRLEFMHEAGYLHRDLKPENIMIGIGKKAHLVYLIDFGLAKRYICPQSGQHGTYLKMHMKAMNSPE
jgi:serine/threonine protein kinase